MSNITRAAEFFICSSPTADFTVMIVHLLHLYAVISSVHTEIPIASLFRDIAEHMNGRFIFVYDMHNSRLPLRVVNVSVFENMVSLSNKSQPIKGLNKFAIKRFLI